MVENEEKNVSCSCPAFSAFFVTQEALCSYSTNVSIAANISILKNTEHSGNERSKAIRYLSENYSEEAFCALSDIAIHDKDLSLRIQALWVLNKIAGNEHAAKPHLSKAALTVSSSDFPRLRELACEGFHRDLNEENIKHLLNVLLRESILVQDIRKEQNDPPRGGMEVYNVLLQCTGGLSRGGKPWVQTIEAFYQEHREGEIAYCLAHVLSQLGRPVDANILIEGLEKTVYPELKRDLIFDIEVIMDKRAIPVLEKLTHDTTPFFDHHTREPRYLISIAALRVLKKTAGNSR